MANNTTSAKNFFENWVQSQKQMVETMVENSQKFSGNNAVNEAVEKGGDFLKKWLNTQLSFINETPQSPAGNNVAENVNYWAKFYQNWFENQMKWTKEMYEYSQNAVKNMASNQGNMWNMNQGFGKGFDFFSNWNNMMTTAYGELSKNFTNATVKDAYNGMFNNAEGFTKFYEMWMPMLKSIQDKTFNMDVFNKMMNPGMYKEFMDKFFGFAPENVKNYFEQMNTMFAESVKNANNMGSNWYNTTKENMNTMMPWMSNPFNGMMDNYTAFYNNLQNAASPLAKMMTPNAATKAAEDAAEIANQMAIYNIKNAEMQYIIYTNGIKVMEKMAAKIAEKVEKGEEVKGITALYQEWLNTSDKVFVELFESDEYSKLQAELSATSLKVKKAIEMQMEKMFANIPVVPRSEMDELYKTIYDLKKQVYELEKKLNTTAEATEEKAAEPKAAAKKAPKNA